MDQTPNKKNIEDFSDIENLADDDLLSTFQQDQDQQPPNIISLSDKDLLQELQDTQINSNYDFMDELADNTNIDQTDELQETISQEDELQAANFYEADNQSNTYDDEQILSNSPDPDLEENVPLDDISDLQELEGDNIGPLEPTVVKEYAFDDSNYDQQKYKHQPSANRLLQMMLQRNAGSKIELEINDLEQYLDQPFESGTHLSINMPNSLYAMLKIGPHSVAKVLIHNLKPKKMQIEVLEILI